jgi:hypothetical protein
MNLLVIQYVLIEIIAGVSMYYSAYQILKINNVKSGNSRFLGALISAIVYMTSPFIIQRSHHTFILIAYSFTPLTMYFLIKGLYDKKLRYFIYSAFFWSVASGDPHWILLDAIILLGYFAYDVVLSITKKNFTKQKNFYISSFVILITCYFLFSAYWLLPLLASTEYRDNALQPSYILGKDTVQMLSEQSSLINAFQFKTYWLEKQGYTPIPEYLSNPLIQEISIISGFLPIIIGLLGFAIKPKNKFMIFFAILTLTSILLSTGTREFIGTLYLWIIFKAPFSSVYGWMLRSPQEFISLSILGNSFLVAFTIETITNVDKTVNSILKKVPALVVIVMLLSTFFASWPLFTGDLNHDLKPVEIPKEYYSANQWLETQGGNFKVIWMPKFESKDAIWNLGHGSDIFDDEFSDRPTYFVYSHPAFENYYSYVLGIQRAPNSVLLQNKSEYIGKYLQPLNVRYLIFHSDVVEGLGENGLEIGLDNLKNQKDLKLVEQDGFISIFENENYADHISVPKQNILVLGGLDKFTFLNSIGSFSPINTSLLFLDESCAKNNHKYESILTADGLIADESSLDLSLSFLDDSHLLKPFDYASDTYPLEFWSKGATNDPTHGEWHPYLEKFGIENWQSDYDKGLVFTLSPSKSDAGEKDLKMNFKTKASENYHLFIRYFKNQNGGEIKIFLDGREISLETKDELNKFVWKDLGVFYLQSGEHSMALRNVDGFNTVNLFALIPNNELIELQKEVYKSLENKTIIYIFEGEYDIYGENVSLGRRSDASNGKILVFSPQGKAWQEFEIIQEGYYQMAVRVEGRFNIKVDNLTFPINSKNFSFVYLNPIYLDKGLHKIEFDLEKIPYLYSWDFRSQDQINEWKGITYQFGSTCNIFWDKKEQLLRGEFYNSTFGWRMIGSPPVPIDSSERYIFNFSIKSINGYAIHVGIAEFDKNMNELHETYISNLTTNSGWEKISYGYNPLNSSTAYLQLQIWDGYKTSFFSPTTIWLSNVTIAHEPSYLDSVLVYHVNSSRTNQTIEDLFHTTELPPNISFNRVNPTLWEAQINASKPFMLTFTESYDSSWEASIYRNNEIIEEVRPIPLYNVINGFWVNETGNLKIVIKYKSQDWLEIGLIISSLTLITTLLYLFYDWRRGKGKEAKKLERKFRVLKFKE